MQGTHECRSRFQPTGLFMGIKQSAPVQNNWGIESNYGRHTDAGRNANPARLQRFKPNRRPDHIYNHFFIFFSRMTKSRTSLLKNTQGRQMAQSYSW